MAAGVSEIHIVHLIRMCVCVSVRVCAVCMYICVCVYVCVYVCVVCMRVCVCARARASQHLRQPLLRLK